MVSVFLPSDQGESGLAESVVYYSTGSVTRNARSPKEFDCRDPTGAQKDSALTEDRSTHKTNQLCPEISTGPRQFSGAERVALEVPVEISCTSTKPNRTSASVKRLLVTGGAGFIGSNFINYWIKTHPDDLIVNYDALRPMSNLQNIQNPSHKTYCFVKGDLGNLKMLQETFRRYQFTHVVHFAAASNVDKSFLCPTECTNANVYGTHILLEAIRSYGNLLLLVHISTDEVYGEVNSGSSTESDQFAPTNPYAASKAAAECLAMTYGKAYGVPHIVTRANNVYGPYQYPMNAIPRFATSLLAGLKMPIHGAGLAIRKFIHAEDKCRALDAIIHHGAVGEIYNIGTDDEISVLDLATLLVRLVHGPATDPLLHMDFGPDRPYNDARYSVDYSKLTSLGWKAQVSFEQGLKETVEWFAKHRTHWLAKNQTTCEGASRIEPG